ncbi:hypothetical protein [Chromatocurvus halotolerans]|uniref:Transcriptional regulator SutA RNAP-binding domain-containing protein n=1 Tax=Chromatocurvus halotolerans TaxID=1132028 RepID=A0A4R2KPJ1_9GAMM|nr:hypothetical protein [Chromatocurvus halotolerans]TCO75633.1 hypothetical protein EV688_10750 [Chromatocurvus halotolerans]
MIRQSNTPNPAEKQRLRDAINRHVNQFLECGGKIRVIETPQKRSTERLLSPWHSEHEFDGLLD